jgi:hypothetical protein
MRHGSPARSRIADANSNQEHAPSPAMSMVPGRGWAHTRTSPISQIAGEGGTSDLIVDNRQLVPFRCEPQNRRRKASTAGPEKPG